MKWFNTFTLEIKIQMIIYVTVQYLVRLLCLVMMKYDLLHQNQTIIYLSYHNTEDV